MSIGDLPAALAGVGKIDVVAFDMCLMAGYETLSKLSGLADFAVASQENEPGEGYAYDSLITAMNAAPALDARALATLMADSYHSSVTSNRSSTTVSAFDLNQYAAFENSLNALATTLRTNITALAPAIREASAQSQRFSLIQFKDLHDFLGLLRARISDPNLLAQIDALRGQITGGFRLRNHVRRGTASNSTDVSRAAGLHVMLPSGVGTDQAANTGPMSLTAYQAILSGKPWTQFLQSYMASSAVAAYTDQANRAFQTYLVWDTASISRRADIDVWVLEPNGNLYVPYLGAVTPNGLFTADSYDVNTAYEGYLSKRFVQNGRYKFYADLYTDPANHRPVADIAYRYGTTDNFVYLYAGNGTPLPRLSKTTSWRNDPSASFARIEAGAYTDVRYMAYVDMGPTTGQLIRSPIAAPGEGIVARSAVQEHTITGPQLATVKSLLDSRPRTRGAARSQPTPAQLKSPETPRTP